LFYAQQLPWIAVVSWSELASRLAPKPTLAVDQPHRQRRFD